MKISLVFGDKSYIPIIAQNPQRVKKAFPKGSGTVRLYLEDNDTSINTNCVPPNECWVVADGVIKTAIDMNTGLTRRP